MVSKGSVCDVLGRTWLEHTMKDTDHLIMSRSREQQQEAARDKIPQGPTSLMSYSKQILSAKDSRTFHKSATKLEGNIYCVG